MQKRKIRLGVNIDHIATLRNVRRGDFPDLIRAVKILKSCRVDSITVHLREDRRHIKDDDIKILNKEKILPINLEMAATKEMQKICLETNPFACCIVPERREELTTEGGLNVKSQMNHLKNILEPILKKKTRISLFVDPDIDQVNAANELGVAAVELHTGNYAKQFKKNSFLAELEKIKKVSKHATLLGLECHAGHALNINNVLNIAKIKNICELNIGHYIISESIYSGLDLTVRKMKKVIDN